MANQIWQETVLIENSMVDLAGRLQPCKLIQLLQDAAGYSAESLYLSRDGLLEKGVVWMISRLWLRCSRMPKLDEKITLKTWPSGFKKWIWLRHYQVLAEDGAILVEASAYWVLVNYKTRKIVMPAQIGLAKTSHLVSLDDLPDPIKVICPKDMRNLGERNTCYSDVDLNMHMNNASYVRWLCDALPVEYFINHSFGELTINYINEAHMTEKLCLYLKNDGKDFYFSGKSGEKSVFNCQGTWQEDSKVIF